MARINGKNVGTFGHYGAFSLMFGKHMCTGGQGGAVICGNESDYWNERRAADRGKPFGLPPGSTNCIAAISCNIDEFHATVGRVQLKKLPGIVERRRNAVRMLKEKFFDNSKAVSVPFLQNGFEHCYWWWRLKFNSDAVNCTKEEFCAALNAEGLNINPNYTAAMPATMEWYRKRAVSHPWNNPLYKGDAHLREYPTPNCEIAMKEHFILPVLESYGEKETDMIAESFRKVEVYYSK